MKEGWFRERGLYYRTNEFRAGRPTLVLIHGLSGSSSAWRPYEERFEPAFNLLAFDLRGHGRSAKPADYADYAIPNMAGDLLSLLDFLRISSCILISHSFGTNVALAFIAAHPERASAAIFLSPVWTAGKGKIGRALAPLYRLTGLFRFLPFSEAPGIHIDYSRYRQTGDWNVRRLSADIRNTTLRIYLYCLRQVCAFEGEGLLPALRLPTLVINGGKDTISPAREAERAARQIRGAIFLLLPKANHILILNNVPEICGAIERFAA